MLKKFLLVGIEKSYHSGRVFLSVSQSKRWGSPGLGAACGAGVEADKEGLVGLAAFVELAVPAVAELPITPADAGALAGLAPGPLGRLACWRSRQSMTE
jgi:hypothetical protein